MRIRTAHAAVIVATTLLVMGPATTEWPFPARTRVAAQAAPPPVRVAEIHYDNTGTDSGEAIEISAPVGTDLTGWSIVCATAPTAQRTARARCQGRCRPPVGRAASWW